MADAVWAFCVGYAKTPARGRMLVLYGNNGTGKTHVAVAVKKWAEHVAGALPMVETREGTQRIPYVVFLHWPTFLDDLKGGAWESVQWAEESTLLVLDEVGGGHDPSKVGLDKLCRILSKRERRWTLATTNCVPESWEELFDRRVASRLFRDAEHVDLTQVPDFSARRFEHENGL
jgi:DNA replication protein DnaC